MFIVDAFLGNFDRHNGNWGILVDECKKTAEIAPVYDCGSCLYPHHLVKYIATSDGVKKVSNAKAFWNSSKKQQSLITQIIGEFPDSKESLEYEDYLAKPNRENASEFISITLEQHIEQIGDKEKYHDCSKPCRTKSKPSAICLQNIEEPTIQKTLLRTG